jgi:hypothetical protein
MRGKSYGVIQKETNNKLAEENNMKLSRIALLFFAVLLSVPYRAIKPKSNFC